MNKVYTSLHNLKQQGKKALAVLIDPDKTDNTQCMRLINLAIESKIDYFFVGGSLIMDDNFGTIIQLIKDNSSIPVVIFPGNNTHIDPNADAILLLSLISGRNPELLIGQHVLAAPFLKQSKLELLSTGYILIDGGKPTTVSYISNTTPIPADKPSIAACTAMAGEMLGMKLIYLDSGSGAQNPISERMVSTVNRAIDCPLIIGGGIRSHKKAEALYHAGADLIVVGNSIEENPSFIIELASIKDQFNLSLERK